MSKCLLNMAFILIFFPCFISAQEEPAEKVKPRPIRNTFESIWILDHQTVDVPFQKTLEWDIQHRFGTWDNGYEDYFGLAAPSNIRMGFIYVPLENLQIGFGITKERKIWDFSAKYALIKQKQGSGFPFSITYFGSAGLDTRSLDDFLETSDRFSYFNQLLIARRFSDRFAFQLAPSFSYFNFPEKFFDSEGVFMGRMKNQHFTISGMGRIGISDSMGFIFGVDFSLTEHEINDPKNNLSLGIEITTSSHAFQIFAGNFSSLNPQYNNLLNQNSFGDGTILIGFNITRLWNF